MSTVLDQIRSLGIYPYALHLTRIENLSGICQDGKITARNFLGGRDFTDISEKSVQEKRSSKLVPCTGRPLHDYVPFFLSFKTPMVASRQTQNDDLVYLHVNLDIFSRVKGCVVTDGNATNAVTKFAKLERPKDLAILDLGVLYKLGSAGDKERSRKKAAELLVPDAVPMAEIKSLLFYSDSGRRKGLEILRNFGITMNTKVWPKYFFGST